MGNYLFHLNFGTIILLPNEEHAIQIQQYRPMCLLDVSFKVVYKCWNQSYNSYIRPYDQTNSNGLYALYAYSGGGDCST
jgi:hypothetical protein